MLSCMYVQVWREVALSLCVCVRVVRACVRACVCVYVCVCVCISWPHAQLMDGKYLHTLGALKKDAQ